MGGESSPSFKKNKDWNVRICLYNKIYWRQVPNISHLIHLFESVELSTLVLIHTKQCLVQLFHSLPIILGVLVLSTHEGVKTCIFFTPVYARSCTWYVSVKNCLAYAFFGRFTHTPDLPSSLKKNMWDIEILSIRSLRGGGGLSREIFSFFGSSHF